eukprot:CAMPEP_0169400994 /NCGR_PEP_ID=MMETSP1017-20121227/54228_1 /TAXON_ID=342587 /ORGANISM="Karlodinium micrum, Strain CCMP2283" /LENGTH=46 /DNA_ID= /DNA_START= /DNA_END= /DNA_ORIENTATION=
MTSSANPPSSNDIFSSVLVLNTPEGNISPSDTCLPSSKNIQDSPST